MSDLKDIENKKDIETFVNAFYTRVNADPLLAPVFALRIPQASWPAHLQRIYSFWAAILFAEKGFEGNPMEKHFSLPIGEEHFTRWLGLFQHTIDSLYKGPKATEAKKRAGSIAQIMQFKIAAQQQ